MVPLSPTFSGFPGALGFFRLIVSAAFSGRDPVSCGNVQRLKGLLL